MPTSSSYYFREAVVAGRRHGLDDEALLAAVGLSRELIDDPAWRGDIFLLARIVQLVVEALDDEFMGFVSERSKPGTFAMMTHCMTAEPTLEQAVRQGIRFYSLFTDSLTMSLDNDDVGGAVWRVQLSRPELDPSHYYTEFWMSIWYRFVTWLGGEPLQLQRASFGYPVAADRREELALLFRCPLAFDAPATSMTFSAHSLRRPVVRSRTELKEFLAAAPLGVMRPTSEEARVARRVLVMVQPRDGGRLTFPTFGEVASRLFMTEQTLRRRLRDEATSYRAIKESVRRTVAEQKLAETGMSVQDLSDFVGYSEPRAFTRAFQQWTGLSPAAFRAARQQDA